MPKCVFCLEELSVYALSSSYHLTDKDWDFNQDTPAKRNKSNENYFRCSFIHYWNELDNTIKSTTVNNLVWTNLIDDYYYPNIVNRKYIKDYI